MAKHAHNTFENYQEPTNTPVRAAAEGMPEINRRYFLANTVAASAVVATVALPTVADAADTAPAEYAVTRVNRLALELSRAMGDWMEEMDALRNTGYSHWIAIVHPANLIEHPVWLKNAARCEHDPLIEAIQAYKDGNAAFEAIKEADWPEHGGDEAVIDKTYGPPLDALAQWEAPAKTRRGAIEALRVAVQEEEHFGASDVTYSMIVAALGYFEAELPR